MVQCYYYNGLWASGGRRQVGGGRKTEKKSITAKFAKTPSRKGQPSQGDAKEKVIGNQ